MIYRFKYLFESIEESVKSVYDSFISLIKIVVLSKFNVKLPLADKKECIVLGNGPSLEVALEKHKDFLHDKSLFCVNAFPSSKEYEQLKPGNLVWLDSAFYNSKDLIALGKKRPDLVKLISDIIEKTTWPLNIFLPLLAKNAYYLTDISKRNPNVKICYFNYTIVKGYSFLRHFLFKKNLGMPLCQNVLGASIMLALNMGFEEIFIFGADHNVGKNVFVNEGNEVCMLHHHFYDKEKPPLVTNVYKPGGTEKLNIAGFYMLCVKTFQTYYPIEKYATYLKRKVYNATEGSYIDAFERKKIS